MSHGDLAVMFMMISSTLLVTTITFAALWVRAREQSIRSWNDVQMRQPTDRIEHLVNAVEAMSIEVERISEAQRFTAHILSGRSDAPQSVKRVPERVITPH
jgi:hypothetical protein